MPKPPPKKYSSTLPMMWKDVEPSQALLDLRRRYEKAGGNFDALWQFASQPDQRPSPRKSQVEGWKKSVGGLLRWRDLPKRLKPPLEEVHTILRVTIGSPVMPVGKPKDGTLASLVAATIHEELRRFFSKRTSTLSRKDTLTVLQAAAPRTFPKGTTTEALRKRIRRVPRRRVLAYHAKFFA